MNSSNENHISLEGKIEKLDASKWLMYGFSYLTGITKINLSSAIDYLRNVYGFNDNDIIKLATKSSYASFGDNAVIKLN